MSGDGDDQPRPHSAEPLRPRPHSAEPLPPRPQYGEYATPEEQRAHIRQPDASSALDAGHAPAASSAPAAPSAAPPSPVWGAPSSPQAAARPARLGDRIATIALLVYGFVSVLSSVPRYLDVPGMAATILAVFGVHQELSDPAAARPWGIAAAVVLAVGWVATAVISWRRLRSGRLTWWIPLVAGVVCSLVAGILITIPIMSDPAIAAALQKAVGGS